MCTLVVPSATAHDVMIAKRVHHQLHLVALTQSTETVIYMRMKNTLNESEPRVSPADGFLRKTVLGRFPYPSAVLSSNRVPCGLLEGSRLLNAPSALQ